MSGKTLILGLEASCDDTCAAVVLNGRTVLSNVVSSRIVFISASAALFRRLPPSTFGDYYPRYPGSPKRCRRGVRGTGRHPLFLQPGLVGPLLVGVSTAKALSFTLDLPLAAVNHLEGHITLIFNRCHNFISAFMPGCLRRAYSFCI